MHDLNFLQTSVEKKKKSPVTAVLIVLAILMVCGFSLFYILMNLSFIKTENKISELQDYIASEDVRMQYEELNALRSEQEFYSSVLDDLNKLDNHLASINYMQGSVIDKLFAATPSSVEFNSVNFRDRLIDFEAEADNEAAAALWLYQVGQLDFVESASISAITIDELSGKANVSLSCLLVEVNQQ